MSPGRIFRARRSRAEAARAHHNSRRAFVVLAVGLLVAGFSVLAQETDRSPQALRFEGYPGAPAIDVVPRKDQLFFYPCSQCHASLEPNREIRELETFHDAEINHGRGRIWCLSCHAFEDRDYLVTLLGEHVDFDDSQIVCGGCHAERHKDWTFGAHGKRVADWQGARVQYTCTHCHNPHDPAIEPRAPQPPPPVRAGLERDEDAAPHAGEGTQSDHE